MMNAAANLAERVLGHTNTDCKTEGEVSATESMLACTWQGKSKLEMREVPRPTITDDEDAIIRTTGSTVCGSDLHLFKGDMVSMKTNDIMGHECMGIVEDIGPAVTTVKKGDRVVLAFNVACGKCEYCNKQLYTACDNTNNSRVMEKLYGHKTAGILGYSHMLAGYPGCQAEYVRALYANTNLLKVPDQMTDEQALLLADIVPTSYHAVSDTGVQEGDVVGVWGCGPIGMLVVQWLVNVFKASRVIVIDSVQDRLDLVKERFDVETINFEKTKNVVAAIQELTAKDQGERLSVASSPNAPEDIDIGKSVDIEGSKPEVEGEKEGEGEESKTGAGLKSSDSKGLRSSESKGDGKGEKKTEYINGGLDRAIDCGAFRYTKGIMHKLERALAFETDSSEVINEMIRATKKFGTIGLIADYVGYCNHLLIGGIMEKGIRMVGCGQAPIQRYWTTCIEHIMSGRFDPTVVYSHRASLEQTPLVYKLFDNKQMWKVFLETKASNPPTPGLPTLRVLSESKSAKVDATAKPSSSKSLKPSKSHGADTGDHKKNIKKAHTIGTTKKKSKSSANDGTASPATEQEPNN
ncbi:putative alcohol dehydrogenase [Gregarina niphandrodes]|uniref:Alcohol dehydrogenase n=1 Tax=Gregarina niphandrodes TaxID=110365 RepID=A0A023B2Q7_GRENI|nr:putative alcohol dehydrogenase [Gregarina niphandrodes]EZG51530.1 putative alcohol dehydrogenase [Gregarina niphandrodes]|eukprot:XP_011131968.1 putative alcohol dehydrogenase [Gregarina niphandrodes]